MDKPPELKSEWETALRGAGLEGKTLQSLDLLSASKINIEQFLLLKKHYDACFFNPDHVGLGGPIKQANDILANYKDFANYRSVLTPRRTTASNHTIPDLGTFSLVEDFQADVRGLQKPVIQSSNVQFSPSPLSGRTRAKVKAKSIQQREGPGQGAPETPSKPPKGLFHGRGMTMMMEEGEDLDLDIGGLNLAEAPTRPMKISPYPPAPKDASILLERTDDEETVGFPS
ncbi:hypothetical protein BDV35DRAFT_114342 [Aspergillus flavus]|uniref:Unnamed protein product n=4 Tax=Aspergillus subgen. Circumdati TaxID=2720871 RepID=A0A1S9DYV3_ASPOZ|nr:unnamed protein product [Aspergillus oryzae RIB40]EIT75294.1 hypothetical protein Ao3042_09209 [Aspergillus oryzae 3.042]KAB8249902.1 hypothetical protein BDV35DRAFT_114342 [Aspergillus flavus]KDE82637.1 hypothetical protein AO1008_09116 [Aspergillus oryzae 100-8]OOO14232.1 hypothetical protein OAory_01028270 [Aspergillus oryzae]BAE59202.1 unnamed protein product [Aspergillus oryzae RIB40]|eukprot:EIT75294.1 hypothetical protein Ao3042_09209 [Aspergillus oryzae 3.042]